VACTFFSEGICDLKDTEASRRPHLCTDSIKFYIIDITTNRCLKLGEMSPCVQLVNLLGEDYIMSRVCGGLVPTLVSDDH
jgi:hypothetical protein